MQPDEALLSAANGGADEAHDPADILGNVAAMFNAEDVDMNGARRRGANGVYSNPRSKANSSRFLFFSFCRLLYTRLRNVHHSESSFHACSRKKIYCRYNEASL